MFNNNNSDAARIAKTMLKAWQPHERALDENPLGYLDCLIEEITARKPLVPEDLKARLQRFVPGMTLTTAQRLIDLKYGKPGATELLGPRAN